MEVNWMSKSSLSLSGSIFVGTGDGEVDELRIWKGVALSGHTLKW